jgi:hypothetical protein
MVAPVTVALGMAAVAPAALLGRLATRVLVAR